MIVIGANPQNSLDFCSRQPCRLQVLGGTAPLGV